MTWYLAVLPLLLQGALNAIILMLISLFASTIIGTILALIDIWGPRWCRVPIRLFSWIGRSLPPLLILFAVFYLTTAAGWRLSPMVAAIIAFTFFGTAYKYEIIRSGLISVPKGQFEAGTALGIPFSSLLFKVVIPQAVPLMAPNYISHTTVLLKETSLASAISVIDVMGAVNGLIYSAGNTMMLMIMAAAIYLVINGVMIVIETRLRRT